MLRKYPWSPYLAGIAAGVLLALSVLVSGKYFGTSAAFVRLTAMILKVVNPDQLDKIYFLKHPPEVDWKFMFVFGMFAGALVSALMSGVFEIRISPPLWEERLSLGNTARMVVAFVGGILVMVGARLAGGCPSGHGLSGISTLSAGSFLTMAGFMGGGILAAGILYKFFRRR